MRLKPSNIFYSQRDITDTFGRTTPHRKCKIGQTLDAIYYRRTSIDSIPTITVAKKDGKWFTLDNRRLWIFHHLEAAGKCDTIPVEVTDEISPRKFTTQNGGVSVTILMDRDPGGECLKFITPVTPRIEENVNFDTPGEALVNESFESTLNSDMMGENRWSSTAPDSDETTDLESANAVSQSNNPSSVEEKSVFENESEKQVTLKIETENVSLGSSDICSNNSDLDMAEKKATRKPDNINIEEQHDGNADNNTKLSNDTCLDELPNREDIVDNPAISIQRRQNHQTDEFPETRIDKTSQDYQNCLQQGETGTDGDECRLAKQPRLKRHRTVEPGEQENVPLSKRAKNSDSPSKQS